MNSYTDILLTSGPLKTGCAKCEAKKLPICICPKSDSEEEESDANDSKATEAIKPGSDHKINGHPFIPEPISTEDAAKAAPQLVLYDPQHQFQFTLKPGVNLEVIKELLGNFIQALGKIFGTSYNDTQDNIFAITINHPEHFIGFINQLNNQNLFKIQPDQAKQLENIASEGNSQNFNLSPFTMTFKPY